ncbi:MAG: DotA/TraY family protein, partial [Rhodospirillaceae bacterium]
MSAGQFFVPEATDWAANAIDTLFKSDGSLAAAIGAANFVYASIGGVMLLYLIVRVVMETGQHGSIAGKNSEIWFPIRFVTAVGLIAPLPPIGLNAAQYITIGVARASAAAASHVWEAAIDASSDMKPLIVPVPPSVNTLAGKLFMSEFCMAIQNLSADASGSAKITINRTYTSESVRLSYDGDLEKAGVIGQCGSISYAVRPAEAASTAMATEAAGAAQQIAVAHYDAAETLRLALRPAAAQLASQLLPPYSGGKARAPDIDISALMRSYTQSVMEKAGAVIDSSNNRLATYKKTATSAGWVKAGAWGLSLAQVNDTLVSAVTGGMPKVEEPRVAWWSGEVYQSERAAMQAAAQWWGDAYATRKASNEWDA